jgi:subtilisin family serine protease
MQRLLAALLALGAMACSEPTSVPPPGVSPASVGDVPLYLKGKDGIPGRYIVVLKDGGPFVRERAGAVFHRRPGSVTFEYTTLLRGFAAELTNPEVEQLRRDPDIAYIEQDQTVSLSVIQNGATWGIDRIDRRTRPLSGTYAYTTVASGVHVYIIDTGIMPAHSQFNGRAANVYDALGGNGADCNGHGTHVAGIIGGSTYGIAKGVRLRGVRVMNCGGAGTWSSVIAGMEWVRKNRIDPAVANISLAGNYSAAANRAADNLAYSGVFVAVASGNSNQNACLYSPASASAVTTVNSSTSTDSRSSFSNHGSCTHLYAPGSAITSAWIGGSTATRTISGTSMAAPHVTAVAALYKATYGNAPSFVIRNWLIRNATRGVVGGNPGGTPNRLLYKSTL